MKDDIPIPIGMLRAKLAFLEQRGINSSLALESKLVFDGGKQELSGYSLKNITKMEHVYIFI